MKLNNAFGPMLEVKGKKGNGKGKGSKEAKTKERKEKVSILEVKEKELPKRLAHATSEAIFRQTSDCPHRAKGDKQGTGSKGGKGTEKGSRGDKGKKGDQKGGKPKGKRATEFSSFQPESEAGIVSGRSRISKTVVDCRSWSVFMSFLHLSKPRNERSPSMVGGFRR